MQYVLSPKLLTRLLSKFCILLHSNTAGSDYYYYTDVTPLKAKNMLLHHETLKFNVNGCHFYVYCTEDNLPYFCLCLCLWLINQVN